MELFDIINGSVEDRLIKKANYYKIPIGGSFELLPLCNMNCKMCYVHLTKAQMDREGKLLSADEWIRIAEMAKKEGTLYLQLTGGEPLLYPEFKKLFSQLSTMGFLLTMNTNGTLIDEQWGEFFTEYYPGRLNITLYGSKDDTYHKLCGNPKGFSQVMKASELLLKYKIPFRFNYTLTSHNKDEASEIFNIAKSLGVPVAPSSYVFPPVRRSTEEFVRNTPEDTANALINGNMIKYEISDETKAGQARNALKELKKPLRNHAAGYRCAAGNRGFWVNWKGELQACAMFTNPTFNLKEYTFKDAWSNIVKTTEEFISGFCAECEQCKKRNMCQVCLAACLTETGAFSGKPEYLCKVTDAKINRLLSYLDEETQKEYREFLEE